MPHMDHNGPEGKGTKTGRMLGKCHKTETDKASQFSTGTGQAKRRHAGGGEGKGKRKQYNQ